MKKTLMIAALLTGSCTMMLAGTASATTADEVMDNYLEATSSVTGGSADMDMNIAIGITITTDQSGTIDQSIAIGGTFAMDYLSDPLSLKMDGSMDVKVPDEEAQSADMEIYMVPGEDGSWESYTKIDTGDGPEWEYSSVPAAQMEEITALMASGDVSQFPGEYVLSDGTVDVNGTECYQLTAAITYADLEPIISEALSATGEEGMEQTLSVVGMALSGLVLNMELDVDTTTYYPVKMHMDMNGSDLTALSSILGYAFAETDDEGNAVFPEIALDLSDFYIDAAYDYSAPVEITVPEEALSAKENADDNDALSDLTDTLEEIAD